MKRLLIPIACAAIGLAGFLLAGCATQPGSPTTTTLDECRLARLAAVAIAAHPDSTPAQITAAERAAAILCGDPLPPAARGPVMFGIGPVIQGSATHARGEALSVSGLRVFSTEAVLPPGTRLIARERILSLGSAWQRVSDTEAVLAVAAVGEPRSTNIGGRTVNYFESGLIHGSEFTVAWTGGSNLPNRIVAP